ncbi:MAG: BrnA antitoxin family protein [Candidatus Devosia euplotis]|nr:BrnA antitoxin family protein [Candidatus Devosia euplotis]
MMRPPRRTGSTMDQAGAAFKAATSKPVETAPKVKPIPEGREMVTLRLDRAVLEHFQDDGPGWQERINDALRAAAGLDAE